MPLYEYRCAKGHTFEVIQKMSDDPVTTCQTCDAKVQRVFHPIAVHFKGSGFYSTDYGSNKKNGAGEGSGESATSEKSDKSDKKPKSDSKSAASSAE